MPIACDPDRTIEFSPPHDQHLPSDSRPTYVTRFMTIRQRQRVRDGMTSVNERMTNAEAEDALLGALRMGVTGWRNVRTPEGVEVPSGKFEDLPEVYTWGELQSVIDEMLRATAIGEHDLKNSESPHSSGAASSAPPADSTEAGGSA